MHFIVGLFFLLLLIKLVLESPQILLVFIGIVVLILRFLFIVAAAIAVMGIVIFGLSRLFA